MIIRELLPRNSSVPMRHLIITFVLDSRTQGRFLLFQQTFHSVRNYSLKTTKNQKQEIKFQSSQYEQTLQKSCNKFCEIAFKILEQL